MNFDPGIYLNIHHPNHHIKHFVIPKTCIMLLPVNSHPSQAVSVPVASSCILSVTSLAQYTVLRILPPCLYWWIISFYCWVALLCINVPHKQKWTSGFFPVWNYCGQRCCKHSFISFWVDIFFSFLFHSYEWNCWVIK